MPSRRQSSSQQVVRSGPWKGVRDVGDSGMQSPEYLQDAINVYFPDTNGGRVSARPRFERINNDSRVTGSTFHTVLALHSTEVADGTQYGFALLENKLYRWSANTTWTDVTPASTTITGNRRIYCQSFEDEIIISDSAVRPWRASSLGSTPAVRTNIAVNTADSSWFARGAPTLYGGKLFFIAEDIGGTKYANRIVWSEELDAATGYLQDGYTNSWDLAQTSTDKITAIVGTNAGLYYFRRNSIGIVTGAVNADFATSSTHDSVTREVGTGVTTQPLLAKSYIWFISSDGLPHRFRVGSTEIEPIWQQMRNRISKIQQQDSGATGAHLLDYSYIAYSADLNKVAFLFMRDSNASGDYSRNLYVFDADTGNYEGRWIPELASQPSSEESTAVLIESLAGMPAASVQSDVVKGHGFYLGGARPGTTDSGYIWRQTMKRQHKFGDNGSTQHVSITTMMVPNEQNVEVKVDEVAVDVVPDTTAVSLDYYTPYGSSTGLSATGKASSDSIQSSYDHGIARFGLGASAFGRWFRAVFHKNIAAGTTPHAFERVSYKIRSMRASATSP